MNFEDIRPYKDEEVKEKINNLLNEPQFKKIIEYVLPETPIEQFVDKMRDMETILQFQQQIISPIVNKLASNSTSDLSIIGLDKIDKKKNYLFVSTHRDIVLDSAFMNYLLLTKGFNTAEIAIGDNLMTIPWVVDLVKLNKTFIVKRSLPKEQKYEGSLQLSSYINYAIKTKKESVWIAQTSGRSKDGNDQTNPGIIKMFNIAGETDNIIDNIKSLNICPVSISYQYNPCDALTIPELLAKRNGEVYKKAPMEDIMHMVHGIEGKKGNVVVSFGNPINEKLDAFKGIKNKNELFAAISNAIDEEIHQTYKLMPNNYVAYDLINNSASESSNYSSSDKEEFLSYMGKKLATVEGDKELLENIFLNMYANPVVNNKKK